jgi:hypothetical protein
MTLLGKAAVAMWWNIRVERRVEFCDWHSHEHFPERMRIVGFRRGSRWSSVENEEGFFVLYELDDYATLTSPGYMDRLNNPTPWSTKMMPHHLNMVRSQCRIAASFGGGVAALMTTIQLSPPENVRQELLPILSDTMADLPTRPGLTGAHLLNTDTPAGIAPTKEQTIRGADSAADWITLLTGYDSTALENACSVIARAISPVTAGGEWERLIGRYQLSFAMTSCEAH